METENKNLLYTCKSMRSNMDVCISLPTLLAYTHNKEVPCTRIYPAFVKITSVAALMLRVIISFFIYRLRLLFRFASGAPSPQTLLELVWRLDFFF
jgi:hypothetical protein